MGRTCNMRRREENCAHSLFGKSALQLKDNTKIDLKSIEYWCVDWIYLAQDNRPAMDFYVNSNELLCYKIYLLTAIGLSPDGSSTVYIYT
jgi:hypothetical protein